MSNAPDISNFKTPKIEVKHKGSILAVFMEYFWPKKNPNFNPKLAQVPGVAQTPTWAQNTRTDPLYWKINGTARFGPMTPSNN